jgi:hypothetical protein
LLVAGCRVFFLARNDVFLGAHCTVSIVEHAAVPWQLHTYISVYRYDVQVSVLRIAWLGNSSCCVIGVRMTSHMLV